MSAAASPQFEQLPMFMSAREITTSHQPLDFDRQSVNAVLYGTFAPPPPDYANMAVNFGAGYVLGKSLRTLWRGIFNR